MSKTTQPRSKGNVIHIREQRALYVGDVMSILGIGKSKAYQIMRSINEELAAEGYITINGRVPEARFREKVYCGTDPSAYKERSAASGYHHDKRSAAAEA